MGDTKERWQQIGDYFEAPIKPGQVISREFSITNPGVAGRFMRRDVACIEGTATLVLSEWQSTETATRVMAVEKLPWAKATFGYGVCAGVVVHGVIGLLLRALFGG